MKPEPAPIIESKPKFNLNLGGSNDKSGVPSLDFSRLKHVRENDWYAYSKKLEEIIEGLRNKIEMLES
jgi:hypothetical protein